jgi:hypothetical protein
MIKPVNDAVWQGIVKIQWPLAGNAPEPLCLVYDKQRSFSLTVPATQQVRDLMGGKDKCYIQAGLSPRGKLLLGDVVADEAW